MQTDFELVEEVKKGNRSAFSTLVKRHQKGVLRLTYRFLKDTGTAEDVTQDSFIKAYERLNSFEARSTFKSWLYQIAVNTAKNKLRDKTSMMSDIADMALGIPAKAERVLVHGAISKLIQQHVDQLPFKQKTALVLRVYEDLSFKEIAEIMDCPYDTAKANYRHALMKLKEEVSNYEELKFYHQETDDIFTELAGRTAEVES